MKPITKPAESDEGIRLSKRVAALFECSRAEAEHYIENGWVTVAGVIVKQPQFRVRDENVMLAAEANLTPLASVTLIYHKPAGQLFGSDNLHSIPSSVLREITEENFFGEDRAQLDLLKRHLARLTLPCPIDSVASGLVVFTQDGRISRKLIEDAKTIEQEIIVEVLEDQATLGSSGLRKLNHGLSYQNQPIAPMKVSWQNENRLRFAAKGVKPGQISDMCLTVGLTVKSQRRIRIGRLSMSSLPVGQWRYLGDHERF